MSFLSWVFEGLQWAAPPEAVTLGLTIRLNGRELSSCTHIVTDRKSGEFQCELAPVDSNGLPAPVSAIEWVHEGPGRLFVSRDQMSAAFWPIRPGEAVVGVSACSAGGARIGHSFFVTTARE